MKKIEIFLKDYDSISELYPHYDLDADILEVRSLANTDWLYGIDIDGTIVFDTNADFVLVNFDLLVAKRYWKVVGDVLSVPSLDSIKASIGFTKNTINKKSFNFSKDILTNKSKNEIIIDFGGVSESTKKVILSPNCQAFIQNSYLVGFYLKL